LDHYSVQPRDALRRCSTTDPPLARSGRREAAVLSSRAIERAALDPVAFRFIAGNEHADHDTIAEANAKIEARAERRLEREQAEHQVKMAARAEEEKRTGERPPSLLPEPSTGGVREKDPINLTDENSRVMKVASGGFEHRYNAHAVVATGNLLEVATAVMQAANDKEQLAPIIEKIQAPPKELAVTARTVPGMESETNLGQITEGVFPRMEIVEV